MDCLVTSSLSNSKKKKKKVSNLIYITILLATTLMDRAFELEYIGGMYGQQQPTEFICLVLKLLQILPEKEIIIEMIKEEDLK